MNSHGGNAPALQLAINLFYEEAKEPVHLAQWWELASDVVGGLRTGYIHAEEAENSLELYLGQRVLMDRARAEAFLSREALR